MNEFDLIVIGAGPAGSTCATLCAMAGKRVLMLEASLFPREKVCGDCINPSTWPVFERLKLLSRVQSLPSSSPSVIRFSVAGHPGVVEFPMPTSPLGRRLMVVRRRDLDSLLAKRAVEAGVEFLDGSPATSIRKKKEMWNVTTSLGTYRSMCVVGADGRSSIVARQLRMNLPPVTNPRIGLQAHIPYPSGYDAALEMRAYRNGYGGLADLGNGIANLCLVANEGSIKCLQSEVETHYQLVSDYSWRCITPISRPNVRIVARDHVFLCGDAARVVEPFTGEGISFALRSGALLAEILNATWDISLGTTRGGEELYARTHRNLYNGNLCINRLTQLLFQHPWLALKLTPFLIKHPKFTEKLVINVIQYPIM